MKGTILTIIAYSVFSFTTYGVSNDPKAIMKSKYADVKVFAQPSTGSQVLVTLEEDQEVNYVRKSCANEGIWSIVYHDGRPGYVLSTELYEFLPAQNIVKIKKNKKRNFLSLRKEKL